MGGHGACIRHGHGHVYGMAIKYARPDYYDYYCVTNFFFFFPLHGTERIKMVPFGDYGMYCIYFVQVNNNNNEWYEKNPHKIK